VLEGVAEKLDIVYLLVFEKIQSDNSPADISKVLDFSGQEVSYQKYGCSLFVNTLNQHPILGSISILHSHRPVFPLASGTLESPKLWSVVDWCRQGHRKKGLITCVYDLDNKFQGEVLAAMILGEIDLFEISDLGLNENSQLEFWYNLLNAEVYLSIVGASGKDSNCKVLGQVKTWCKKNESSGDSVHLSWLESAQVGNSFISSGSFLEIKVQTDSQFLEIEVNAADLNLLDELEIVFESKVIPLAWDKKGREVNLIHRVSQVEFSWICARVVSRDSRRPEIKAHTNPIFGVTVSLKTNPKK